MRVTFLGTGTSHGVPALDCMISDYVRCPKGVCRASRRDPKHRRTRCSIAVRYNRASVLIDVSPDLRQQALREGLTAVDAVLITHNHADHIAGLPDIRSYTRHKRLPLYGSAETVGYIRRSYSYMFDDRPEMEGGGIPDIDTHVIRRPVELFGKTVTPLPVRHGSLRGCYGYRIGSMAYIPDAKFIPERSMALLEGLDTLIVDALRDERPHSTHLILPESIALARRLRPRKCYFTHLCHDIHYRKDAHFLDGWMVFACDGLTIGCRAGEDGCRP
jgi:phosphoribosyl 1,2-cyclic phosphate phosphodiesterase